MKQYEMFELSYEGEVLTQDYADVELAADFVNNGKKTTVKGFYAGSGVYKIRFLPEETGLYTYRVYGVISDEGDEECESADSGRHGMVQADGMHFRYADGTRYSPFGTTVYGIIHQEKELIDTTMQTLSGAPFNKIRFCV